MKVYVLLCTNDMNMRTVEGIYERAEVAIDAAIEKANKECISRFEYVEETSDGMGFLIKRRLNDHDHPCNVDRIVFTYTIIEMEVIS